jgi:hypothetical protein
MTCQVQRVRLTIGVSVSSHTTWGGFPQTFPFSTLKVFDTGNDLSTLFTLPRRVHGQNNEGTDRVVTPLVRKTKETGPPISSTSRTKNPVENVHLQIPHETLYSLCSSPELLPGAPPRSSSPELLRPQSFSFRISL